MREFIIPIVILLTLGCAGYEFWSGNVFHTVVLLGISTVLTDMLWQNGT